MGLSTSRCGDSVMSRNDGQARPCHGSALKNCLTRGAFVVALTKRPVLPAQEVPVRRIAVVLAASVPGRPEGGSPSGRGPIPGPSPHADDRPGAQSHGGGDAILLVAHAQGTVRYISRACEALLGCDSRLVLGQPCWKVMLLRASDDTRFCAPDCAIQRQVRDSQRGEPRRRETRPRGARELSGSRRGA